MMILRLRGIGFLPIYSLLIFFKSFWLAADTDPDTCTYFNPQHQVSPVVALKYYHTYSYLDAPMADQ